VCLSPLAAYVKVVMGSFNRPGHVVRAVAGMALAWGLSPGIASARTLGFVVTTWNMANYETRFIDECPRGLAMGYDELWWRSLSKEERARLTENGLVSRQDRYKYASKRGRNGEDTCLEPTSVDTPPMLTVEGKIAYGENLDGNTDGSATPLSCPHENFTSPDGRPGIDNQLYRLLGCVFGFRSFGYFDANPNNNRKTQGLGMILIEITGVDDPRNDASVEVTFYRSIDVYPVNAAGEIVPYGSYRIDTTNGRPRYGVTVHGRIVNGVVRTEPGNVDLPYYGNYAYMDMFLKNMRLTLQISPDGKTATGLVAGYLDVDELNYYIGSLGITHATTYSDCASIYVTSHQLADGYPDPETHRCTALSAAYQIHAVAAFVSHPRTPDASSEEGPWRRLLLWLGAGERN
jgi:hypothetical protein